MRYMDLESHKHKVYKYWEIYIIIMRVFMKKTSYQMSINKERTTTTQGVHISLVRILSFLLFLS